jgi:F0F1-type ATP synthase beta subunit
MEDGIYQSRYARNERVKTFVFGQMNEPPGARARVALSGLSIAEFP